MNDPQNNIFQPYKIHSTFINLSKCLRAKLRSGYVQNNFNWCVRLKAFLLFVSLWFSLYFNTIFFIQFESHLQHKQTILLKPFLTKYFVLFGIIEEFPKLSIVRIFTNKKFPLLSRENFGIQTSPFYHISTQISIIDAIAAT